MKQYRQGLKKIILFLLLSGMFGCVPKTEIDPPSTPPLSRAVLGYGVVTAPYTRVLDEPSHEAVALGFVREKSVLTVLERRLIREGDVLHSWVYTAGSYRGWLPESVIKLYDNQDKALTAASH